jgi:hypothetical protein
MKVRIIAALCFGCALLGTVATLVDAQPPDNVREARLRLKVVELQTEVQMLHFDYELRREAVLEELKMVRGMRMMGGVMSFAAEFNAAVENAEADGPGVPQPEDSELDPKQAAEQAKAAKEQEEQEATFLAEQKKELVRLFALVAEKRLDLEEAERKYRETLH